MSRPVIRPSGQADRAPDGPAKSTVWIPWVRVSSALIHIKCRELQALYQIFPMHARVRAQERIS